MELLVDPPGHSKGKGNDQRTQHGILWLDGLSTALAQNGAARKAPGKLIIMTSQAVELQAGAHSRPTKI